MVPAWTVSLSYLGSGVMLALGAAIWLSALFETLVYDRVEMGRLGQGWLTFSQALTRHLDIALWAAVACAAAAFVLAALPAGDAAPVAKAHKAYQLKYGAIAVGFLVLADLARVRMGAFDADIGSVVLFAWSLWVVIAGWRAFAGGVAVAGPALWWLALVVDGLLFAVFAFFFIMINIQGFRMF
jgi:uncharacterized membrane protein